MPFIQRVLSCRETPQRGRGGLEFIGHQRGHGLHRHRGDVVIGGHRLRALIGGDGRARDSRSRALDGRHARAAVELHAQFLEILSPRRDPYVVGGAAQQPVEDAVGADQPVEHLKHDIAHGASAALFGAHRHEGSRHSLPQVGLVVVGHSRRFDEVPPADVFVLRQPARLAARGQDQQAADEERHLVRRHTERCQQLDQEHAEFLNRRRRTGHPRDLRPPRARQHHPGRQRQVVVCVAVRPIRNAAHGIGDVLVEARKEAESVFPGKIGAPARA